MTSQNDSVSSREGGASRRDFVTAVTAVAAAGAGTAVASNSAQAQAGTSLVGTADRWMYVGGTDREFSDPRLNEDVLRRLARQSGGRYVAASDTSLLIDTVHPPPAVG